jgi:hypothetical protein
MPQLHLPQLHLPQLLSQHFSRSSEDWEPGLARIGRAGHPRAPAGLSASTTDRRDTPSGSDGEGHHDRDCRRQERRRSQPAQRPRLMVAERAERRALGVDRLAVAPCEDGHGRHPDRARHTEHVEIRDERGVRDQGAAPGQVQRRARPCQRGTVACGSGITRPRLRGPGPGSGPPRPPRAQRTNRSTTARIAPSRAITTIPPESARGIQEYRSGRPSRIARSLSSQWE